MADFGSVKRSIERANTTLERMGGVLNTGCALMGRTYCCSHCLNRSQNFCLPIQAPQISPHPSISTGSEGTSKYMSNNYSTNFAMQNVIEVQNTFAWAQF
jgi:hypothetical protein